MSSIFAPLLRAGFVALLGILFAGGAMAGTIEVFHADSLGGPMREMKKAFEAKNAGVTINLTAGIRSGRRHEGHMRGASAIMGIRAWDGRKGRWAILSTARIGGWW